MKKSFVKNVVTKSGSEEGITLIALIITIVVLLILAGVTLNLTLGERGIFNIAKKAGENYTNASEKELADLDNLLESFEKEEKLPENTKDTQAGTKVAYPEGWLSVTPSYVREADGKEIKTSEVVATVDAISDGTGNTIPVPKGFYYVGGTIESGVVISDNPHDKNKYASAEKAPNGVVPAGAIYNADGTVKQIYDENGNRKEGITEEEANTAIVGKQFVWIPCSEENYTKIESFPTNVTGNWDRSTNRAEIVQIQKYGGFYIGRFEAGANNITFAGDKTLKTPTGTSGWLNSNYTKDKVTGGKIETKPGEIPYYHADYYTAVEMSNRMYTTSTVTSGLMTGTMWDVVMKYITKTSDYSDLTNTRWGNYKEDTGLTYEQGRGKYIVVDSSNGIESGSFVTSDTAHHYGIRTTGFSDGARKNNIYDLAGNLWEWTRGNVL